MKNLNNLIRKLQSYYWLGFCVCILPAEVVITEFFINSAEGTQIPQYIELYNTSSDIISLEGWSIKTFVIIDDQIETYTYLPQFTSTNSFVTINAPLEIKPLAYFLISSQFDYGYDFYNGNSDIEVYFQLFELGANFEGFGEVSGGSIILFDNNNNGIDTVEFDEDWPLGEESRGHSLRLHVAPNADENDDYTNWSLSPETEKSPFLNEGSEILNYGSPREENAFKLIAPEIYVHIISGDIADYSYGDSLIFSWKGTFYEVPHQSYRLIIKKLDSWKPTMHGFSADTLDKSDTLIWEGLSDTIYPVKSDSLIDQLEVANYTWTVELTKTYSDTVDIIYSDKYSFTIDASDYGIYGCVDDGCCTNDSNEVGANGGCPILCPTSADNDTLKSNHPTSCTPGVDCFSALNYHEDANINSNTCHYVSLSIPAFVVGDFNETVSVPVYFKNDSLAEINEIEFTLNDADSSIGEYAGGTILETVLSQLNDAIIDAKPESNSVIISLSSARIAGIITYLDFNLIGLQGEFTDLTISEVRVNGGNPINEISVPVSGEGELVILQSDYEIYGQVYYYDSSIGEEPFQVPNVELTLNKMYDGVSADTSYIYPSSTEGYFIFNSLTEGNYNLSFSKDSTNDCNGNYISGTDISRIARHVIGSEPFNTDQLIAADVSLDGTVSGYDVSLVAQYAVDLIDNFNDIPTHWIFQPIDLPDVHAELVKENGQYSIEYKPLVLDDKSRNISAYRLGDVNGNYCHDDCHQYTSETDCNMYDHCWWDNEYDECAYDYNDQLSRFNSGQVQFTNIAIDYTPVITLPLIISEPIFLEGMDIEIGYDEDVFSPHSITFNTSNIKTERYNSISNLLSRDGSIKTVTWAIEAPQIVEGIIGKVSFNWNNKNKSGKIWLKEFQVNDEPAVGGISLIGLSDNDVADGVNIINSLVPVELSLHQNYPNPFNPQTTIKWSMPLSGIVSLEVYNLKGQYIDHLFYGFKEVGTHEQIWDATAYPSGIYFYRLKTHEKTLQKIMLLLK